MKLKALLSGALIVAASVSPLAAEERASKEEAVALVDRAVEHIKKVGTDQAFKEFSTPGGPWHDRDLYLFAYNDQGENVAHGANPKLIGKNLIDMRTADGQLLIKNMVHLASTKGSGWIDYEWPHPQTKKVQPKTAFIRRIPDFGGFIGSGVYQYP
jgi:cytochrome c